MLLSRVLFICLGISLFGTLCATGHVHHRLTIAQMKVPEPQLILVLGGDPERELFAGDLAQAQGHLPVVISSRRPQRIIYRRLEAGGMPRDLIAIDSRATDTVGNFTTLVKQFRQNGIHHIYLVTSDYHMPRAKAIAFWILGSHDIGYTAMSVKSPTPSEPVWKIPRDILRSWFWLMTKS